MTNYPEATSRVRVSTDGGFAPLFSPDGTELFFMSGAANALLTVAFEIRDGLPVLGRPETLFAVDIKVHTERQYDTVDGQRFLVVTEVDTGALTPLKVVLTWAEGL